MFTRMHTLTQTAHRHHQNINAQASCDYAAVPEKWPCHIRTH